MSAGIVLVIGPLLALTADQVEKIKRANQKYGSVEAHHIDDSSDNFIQTTLIPQMQEINYESPSTMFVFSSPQALVEKAYFLHALLECYRKNAYTSRHRRGPPLRDAW